MDPLFPDIDLTFHPRWYWFNGKFGLEHEDLFTTLHDRFNTKKSRIQDPVAFHRDVVECSATADTLDKFYSALEERKAERIKELDEAWEEVSLWLAAFPSNMFCQLCYDRENFVIKLKPGSLNDDPTERAHAFQRFTRTMSFDSMVAFFDGFARDERRRQKEGTYAEEETQLPFESQRADEGLAAHRALGMAASDTTSPSPRRSASNEPNLSRDAPTTGLSFPAAAISDKPKPTQRSSRRAQDQPEMSAQPQTTRSLTRKRSDESNENADEPPKKKKKCVMSAGGSDAEKSVEQEKQTAAEAPPTLGQAKKRKRANEADDSQTDARKKQPRIADDSFPTFTELMEGTHTQIPDEHAYDTITSEAASLLSTAVPHDFNPDMIDEECDEKNLERFGSSSSASTDNLLFVTAPSSLTEDTGKGIGLKVNASTTSAGARGLDREPQPSRRQSKGRRRGEQKSSTPKKRTRQRVPKEQNASPIVQQILQSHRSSRRSPAHKLFLLGDNGTACAAATKKRN